MSLAETCHRCGEGRLVADITTNSGNLTCDSCGRVAYENPMVSEVQFGETSAGGAVVQGQMVGAGQARAPIHGRQNAMESREQTLINARRNIRDLAASLNIPEYIYEAACGWFQISLNHNFVQGRRSQNVIAACLYIACRKEKTHHMLIDFSSKLQLSVFSLGATFLKMVRALNIVKLPLADPSIFIAHFAEKLGFDGERKNGKIKVIKDALQIAKRMSDDWIHEGRRPAGVAGACVLMAARMNGFRRTHAEMVAVAHVSEETIQTRMDEFSNTTSGSALVREFRQKSSSYSPTDPPSLLKNSEREAKLKNMLEARKKEWETLKKNNFKPPAPVTKSSPPQITLEPRVLVNRSKRKSISYDTSNEIVVNQEPNTSSLRSTTGRLAGLRTRTGSRSLRSTIPAVDKNNEEREHRDLEKTTGTTNTDNTNADNASPDNTNADNSSADNTNADNSNADNANADNANADNANADNANADNAGTENASEALNDFGDNDPESSSSAKKYHDSIVSELAFGHFTPNDLKKDIALYERIYTQDPSRTIYEAPSKDDDAEKRWNENRPRNLAKYLPKTQDFLDKVSSSLDIGDSDMSLEEEESYFNDEEAVKRKEIVWLSRNKDYLEAQERKRLKLETDELTGNTSASRKKKRQANTIEGVDVTQLGMDQAVALAADDDESPSAAASVQKMLSRRAPQYSKKINYEHLSGLFGSG